MKTYKNFDEYWADYELDKTNYYKGEDSFFISARKAWNAAQNSAQCPHVTTSSEGTSYCNLAEVSVARLGNEVFKLKQELIETERMLSAHKSSHDELCKKLYDLGNKITI